VCHLRAAIESRRIPRKSEEKYEQKRKCIGDVYKWTRNESRRLSGATQSARRIWATGSEVQSRAAAAAISSDAEARPMQSTDDQRFVHQILISIFGARIHQSEEHGPVSRAPCSLKSLTLKPSGGQMN
jgi:predicted ribonuclease toxin of YeeF-YezG toxin-antitoxin module